MTLPKRVRKTNQSRELRMSKFGVLSFGLNPGIKLDFCHLRKKERKRKIGYSPPQKERARNILQHAATHCNALQHTTTHFITLHHSATHFTYCNTLQHNTTQCNTMQHTVTHCNTMQHTATYCNTLQHAAAHCNTLQHTAKHAHTLSLFVDCLGFHGGELARKVFHVRCHSSSTCCARNTLQYTTTHCNTLQHTLTHGVSWLGRHI